MQSLLVSTPTVSINCLEAEIEFASTGQHKEVETHRLSGYLLIAAAALCWGASATIGKAVFNGALAGQTPIDPVILAQSRTTFSLLVFAPLLLLTRGPAALRIGRRDLVWCLLTGVLGIAGSNFLYYYAIQKTTVATGITVQYTAPVWVLLYMALRKQQRATLSRIVAVVMSLFGSMLVVGVGSSSSLKLASTGVVAALGAAFSFAFYNIAGAGLVRRRPSWLVMFYAIAGSVIFWLIVNPPWRVAAHHYSFQQWMFLAGFAIVSMLLPYNLFFAGLRYLDATRAIVTSCLEPVFAIVFAAIFVGESLGIFQIVGIALVLIATIIIQMPEAVTSTSQ
jgi:drug/metabolite transporter, DME family